MSATRDGVEGLIGSSGSEKLGGSFYSYSKMAPNHIHFKANLLTMPRVLLLCLFGAIVLVYTRGFGVVSWEQSNKTKEQSIELKDLLSVAIELAERGGDEVRRIHDAHKGLQEQVKGKTLEGAKEMLTEGDLSSHRAMIHGLLKAYPDIHVISEENENSQVDITRVQEPNRHRKEVEAIVGDSVPLSDISVWIDPLDATQEYTESLTQYVTTMVCVAVSGRPTIGVIHLPFSKETMWGYVNQGHSPNLKPASSKTHKEGASYNIIVSRSHAGDVKDVAQQALGADTVITPAGGAGFKTLQVIQGKADAYVHVTRIKKWDICAGDAILKAVQGKMTTLHNTYIDYSLSLSEINDEGLLATLGSHEQFLNALKPAFDQMKKE